MTGIFIAINAKKGIISGTFEESTYAATFFKLSNINLPSLTPKTIELKSSLSKHN